MLKLPNSLILMKQGSLSLTRNVALKNFLKTNISYPLIRTRTFAYQGVTNASFSEYFAHILNLWSQTVFSTKVNVLSLLYLRILKCFLLDPIRQICLLILFPRTIILLALDDYWYLFTSCFRFTNLKLQYNPVSHRIVKKMITNLDQTLRRLLQMVFWWWFWRSEYSYILNDLFSMYFIWKVSLVVPVFKNVKKLCE